MTKVIVPPQYTDHVHPWEEICHFVVTNQITLLRRNRTDEEVYRQWLTETLPKYNSIEDYLLKEKLHFSDSVDGKPNVIILPNDFPYSVDPGIKHILLWSQAPLSTEYVIELLEENYGSKKWEWVYFVNPPETQSVRLLPHVHVFMRPRTHTI
ncbi:hypothetical protein CLU79DRAFT_752541 [Phycomyces nitens]|nr:hypothetical protein CLU79DRAFT_752541 [Phycomyces nitens]